MWIQALNFNYPIWFVTSERTIATALVTAATVSHAVLPYYATMRSLARSLYNFFRSFSLSLSYDFFYFFRSRISPSMLDFNAARIPLGILPLLSFFPCTFTIYFSFSHCALCFYCVSLFRLMKWHVFVYHAPSLGVSASVSVMLLFYICVSCVSNWKSNEIFSIQSGMAHTRTPYL